MTPGRGEPASFFVERLLGLKREDLAKSGLFFLYLLLCETVFTAAIPIRDTLFLGEYGVAALPWMFVLYGLVSTVFATLHGKIADRVPRLALICGTCGVVSAGYVALWFAVRSGTRWCFPVLYLWAEVSGTILLTQFWLLASDLHTPRDAKRVFGVIGSGMVLGIVLGGVAVRSLVEAIGTANILLAIAALVLACAAVAAILWTKFGADSFKNARRALESSGLRIERGEPEAAAGPVRYSELARSRYLRLVAAVMLTMALACTIVDFQWKSIVSKSLQGDQLASYFGTLNAVIGSVAFLIQLFVTSRVLSTFGVVAGLFATPLLMLGASAALTLSPGILAVTALKFSDVAFRCSINDASVQLLYMHFPEATKGRVRALMDGAIGPLAFALSGLLLLAIGQVSAPERLAMLTIPILSAWMGLVVLLGREYLATLQRTLRSKKLRRVQEGDSLGEGRAVDSLLELAIAGDDDTTLFAVKWAKAAAPARAVAVTRRLLARDSADVQVAALELLERQPAAAQLPSIEAAMAPDRPPAVRAAAARAFAAMIGPRAIDRLLRMIRPDARPGAEMTRGVLAGLMKHAGAAGGTACGPEIERLLHSGAAEDRAAAAAILGEAGDATIQEQLLPLLSDPDAGVRRSAIRAAGACRGPLAVPTLIAHLGDRETAADAEKALASFGDAAVGELAVRLSEPGAAADEVRAVIRALRGIATPAAFSALIERPTSTDEKTRCHAYRAAARIAALGVTVPDAAGNAAGSLEREARFAYQLAADRVAVLTAHPGRLLDDLFKGELSRARERLWSLVAIASDPPLVSRIRRNLLLGTGTQRANALELLESLLPRQPRPAVVALLEGRTPDELADIGGRLYSVAPLSPIEWLRGRIAGSDEWSRAVTLDAAGAHGLQPLAEGVDRAMSDSSALVREAAVWAAWRLGGTLRERAMQIAARDPDPRLHEMERALQAGGHRLDGLPVMTRLDIARSIQSVPLFASVRHEELAALADLAHLRSAATGEIVVRQSEPGDCLYLVLEGRLEAVVDGCAVGSVEAPQCFGEMALLERETRSATVRACEPCALLELSHDGFREFVARTPDVGGNLLRGMLGRIRELNRRLAIAPAAIRALLLAISLAATGCGWPAKEATGTAAGAGQPVEAIAPPLLPAIDGRALAARIRDNLSTPYESLAYSMVLADSRGATEEREATFHLASNLDGRDCAYTCFTKPEEIRGFGLLTVRPGRGDPDQFLYVPASKRVSRVLYFSTNRRSSFCGTQFSFEDLEPLRVDDFEFKVSGTEQLAGRACYRLESVPKSRSSGYARLVHTVDAKTALVLRSVFRDTRDQLLKTLTGADPFEIAPGRFRLRQVEVVNHQTARATRMTLRTHRVVTGPAGDAERAIFTLATLSQGREK